jgi:hypothetical protein
MRPSRLDPLFAPADNDRSYGRSALNLSLGEGFSDIVWTASFDSLQVAFPGLIENVKIECFEAGLDDFKVRRHVEVARK